MSYRAAPPKRAIKPVPQASWSGWPQYDRPARADQVAEATSIALVGQHGPVVGPTEGGAEHAEELAVRKKERSLVEAVASDDHLLEADDVGRLGRKPTANDCHPLLEGLGHAPAVDGQHSQVSPHRAPPPLVSGERLTRARRAFPEELRSDAGRSDYAEGVPGCDHVAAALRLRARPADIPRRGRRRARSAGRRPCQMYSATPERKGRDGHRRPPGRGRRRSPLSAAPPSHPRGSARGCADRHRT